MEISRINSDHKKQHASFIDFSNTDESIYCDRCNSVGVRSRLSKRVLEQDEPIPNDYEVWRQCLICGRIVNIQNNVKHESKLVENIQIQNKAVFVSMDDNGKKKRKGTAGIKRYNSKLGINEKDKEIAELIRKGYDVNVIQ